jgi:hypothetical protein
LSFQADRDVDPQLPSGVRPTAEPSHRFEFAVHARWLQGAIAAEMLPEMSEVAGRKLFERSSVPGKESRDIAPIAAHRDGREIFAGQRLQEKAEPGVLSGLVSARPYFTQGQPPR